MKLRAWKVSELFTYKNHQPLSQKMFSQLIYGNYDWFHPYPLYTREESLDHHWAEKLKSIKTNPSH